jgi:Leucine-rich repeat (LRR) protein
MTQIATEPQGLCSKHRKSAMVLVVILMCLHAVRAVPTPTPIAPPTLSPLWPCTVHPDPWYYGDIIKCTGLNLTEVPFSLPETTTTLLLDNNSLSTLRNNSFTHVPNLRELDVSLNLLSVLEVKAFAGLGQLVRLSLRGNNLTLSPRLLAAKIADLTGHQLQQPEWRHAWLLVCASPSDGRRCAVPHQPYTNDRLATWD